MQVEAHRGYREAGEQPPETIAHARALVIDGTLKQPDRRSPDEWGFHTCAVVGKMLLRDESPFLESQVVSAEPPPPFKIYCPRRYDPNAIGTRLELEDIGISPDVDSSHVEDTLVLVTGGNVFRNFRVSRAWFGHEPTGDGTDVTAAVRRLVMEGKNLVPSAEVLAVQPADEPGGHLSRTLFVHPMQYELYGTADDDLSTTAVLVKSYKPTARMRSRMVRWAESAARCGACLFVVLMDTTRQEGQVAVPTLMRQLHERAVQLAATGEESEVLVAERLMAISSVFPYTADDIEARYPALAAGSSGRRAFDAAMERHRRVGTTINWCFHNEGKNLWAQTLGRNRFEFLWTIEDDVEFTGDLCKDLFLTYAMRNDDYIGARVEGCGGNPRQPFTVHPDHWPWKNVASDKWLASFAENARFVGPEQVQRLSRRLLDELERLSKTGLVAWSEMATPTAIVGANFTESGLREEHYGPWFNCEHFEDRNTSGQVDSYWTTHPNTLHHPCKF